MNGANRTAREIVTYVGMERGDVALLRTSDLTSQTSYFLARWNNRLSEESKNNLLSAGEQLRLIHRALTKGPVADLNPKAKGELGRACQQVNAIFSEEYGRAVRTTEREVH